MSYRTTAGAAALTLALLAGSAVAAEPPSSSTAASEDADYKACLGESQTLSVFTTNHQEVSSVNGRDFVEPVYNLGTALFGGLGGMVNGKARQEYVASCMEGRGHAPPIPKAERATPLLPQAAVEPFTVGALRIDPASLKASPGVISGVNRLLVGTANYRGLAVLRADATAGGVVLPAGTVLRQFVHDGDEGDNASYWCPTKGKRGLFGVEKLYCLWQDRTGLTVYANEATTRSLYFVLSAPTKSPASTPLSLEPIASKPEDVMTFDIALTGVGEGGVTIAAEVSREGDTVVFWRTQLLFDAHGKAVLPFWNHRLVLTKEGSGVTAEFTADGDGKDWNAADMGAVW